METHWPLTLRLTIYIRQNKITKLFYQGIGNNILLFLLLLALKLLLIIIIIMILKKFVIYSKESLFIVHNIYLLCPNQMVHNTYSSTEEMAI